jgi:hypothetical protein
MQRCRTPILPIALGAGLLALVPVAAHAARPVDHGPFSLILRDHVRDERVDYLGIREFRWDALNVYLDSLAGVDPLELRGANRLTFYINLYNATTLHAVIERLRAGYSVSENEHGLFNEQLVRLNGRLISLNELEHQRVRPEFRDPRIHAALVCAAVSCPPLLPRAYERADLDHTLNTYMRRFVLDPKRNRIDAATKTMALSSIFDWYSQDFLSRGGVAAYVDSIVPADLTEYRIEFLPYDWTLNLAAPKGEWVQARADGAALRRSPGGAAVGTARKGDLFRVIERSAAGWRVVRPFGKGEAWISSDDAGGWSPG